MRFTRDFLLLAGLFIMVAGIGAGSLWWQRIASTAPGGLLGELEPGREMAVAEGETLDRSELIASLRALLPSRDVLPGAVEPAAEEPQAEQLSTTSEAIAPREVTWCDATVLESAIAARWPAGIEVVVEEGARVARVPGVASADPLVPGIPPQPVLQLPLYGATGGKNCLTNAYIGVTQGGRLIHNNDVILYIPYGVTDLVGYALDGHPIYGPSADDALDSCGGTVTAAGYHYHIRSDEPFILACFSGDPSTIMGS